MVCKEEIYAWFKHLNGSSRIEIICNLLNMCLPLELRFFGTCLEDLGRKDFDVFRDVEPKANNIKDISDITSNSIILLSDRVGRSKLIVFLALLNSSNRGGANVLYNILINSLEYGDIEFCLVDNTAASEILLLFTMAFHHPAFTFVQKSRLAERLESIEKFCSSAFLNDEPSISSKQSIYEHTNPSSQTCSLPYSMPVVHTAMPIMAFSPTLQFSSLLPGVPLTVTASATNTSTCPLQSTLVDNLRHSPRKIENVQLKSMDQNGLCTVEVIWSDGRCTEVVKTVQDIYYFHQMLAKQLNEDTLFSKEDMNIPHLPDFLSVDQGQSNSMTDDMGLEMAQYLRQLVECSIITYELVASFFQYHSTDEQSDGDHKLKTVLVYGSTSHANKTEHFSKSTDPQQLFNTTVSASLSTVSFSCTPIHSANNSNNDSSEINWRGSENMLTLEQILKKENLRKYLEKLHSFGFDEIQNLSAEELKSKGLTLTAARRLRKLLDAAKCNMTNGFNNHCIQGISTSVNSSVTTCCLSVSSSCGNPSIKSTSKSQSGELSQIYPVTPGSMLQEDGYLSKELEEPQKRLTTKKDTTVSLAIQHITNDSIVDSSTIQDRDCALPNIANSSHILSYDLSGHKPVSLGVCSQPSIVPPHLRGGVTFESNHMNTNLVPSLKPSPAVYHSTDIGGFPYPVVTSGSSTIPTGSHSLVSLRGNNTCVTVTTATGIPEEMRSVKQKKENVHVLYPVTPGMMPPGIQCGRVMHTPVTTAIPCSNTVLPYSCYVHQLIPQPISFHNNTAPPVYPMLSHGFHFQIPNGLTSPDLMFSMQNFPMASPPSAADPNISPAGGSLPVADIVPSFVVFPGDVAPNLHGDIGCALLPPKPLTCYNCGARGHTGNQCKGATLEEMTSSGNFLLNFASLPETVDPNEQQQV
ncbi:uncharacterized protein LOC143234744 [Tachypleus tridentatus]|uniref:uncharacterized protein LOC143234744 n=1 Tax=Tachypleus tridentatus TaxID=6853 RepID=UPI003FD2FF2A